MQDAELFFQAADHRHLFLYIDGLAEAAARRQADEDDYAALQKKVKRLEQELQQEKDANARLQTQLAQQNSDGLAEAAARRLADEDDYAALQKKVKRLEQELQQALPLSRLWRIPILRKRLINDALARGIFFPPAPETVPDALQRLLANENIFAGIDAAALSREQGLRIPVLRESLCLLYIALEKFPDLTWETVLNILSATEVFEDIALSRLAPSNFRLEKTPLYLVTYNGIWIHQHEDWKKLATSPQELGKILSQKTLIGVTSEEVCIALNARLSSSELPRP